MNNLKAIYDYLNNNNNNSKTDDHSGAVSVSKTGDFWTWLKYTFEGPPSSRSPSATVSFLFLSLNPQRNSRKKIFPLPSSHELSHTHNLDTIDPTTRRRRAEGALR